MISFIDWKAERSAALLAEDGWLNLTDRVEIPTGPQKLGRTADTDLVLSVGPDHLGVRTATALTPRRRPRRAMAPSRVSRPRP